MLAAVLCGLMAATPAIAQGPTGVINGQVLDSSQSAMPGVSVTARHLGTGDTRHGHVWFVPRVPRRIGLTRS
jgi:hypothetical protein